MNSSSIKNQAQLFLDKGEVGNSFVCISGQVGEPIEVMSPEGTFHSFFVPVTIGDSLVGYFHFLSDGTLLGYSSFQCQVDSLAGCPESDTWLDKETIRQHAETNGREGEVADDPVLTYETTPSRLVWAVTLRTSTGSKRKLYIAGKVSWQATDGGTEKYGGC